MTTPRTVLDAGRDASRWLNLAEMGVILPAGDRKADDAKCGEALLALAGAHICTPTETYGKDLRWAASDLIRGVRDLSAERDALRALIERLTSDESVEIAAIAFWNDDTGEAIKAAITAALRVAKEPKT